jgi:hypothetical protein
MVKHRLYLLIALAIALTACDNSTSPESVLPLPKPFRTQIFLTNTDGRALQQFPYAIYADGGLRGLIVTYNQASNTYYAFDRNCTYQPKDSCARVNIDVSGLYLIDTCCGSRYSMQGDILKGPTRYTLRPYTVQFIPPSQLLITDN